MRGRRILNRRQFAGGVGYGLVNTVNMPLMLLLVMRLGAEITFPIAVATPMILMLPISHFAYGDDLPVVGWLACAVGAAAVACLAISQAG